MKSPSPISLTKQQLASSELAKSLALQGVKIPIRNEERKRSHKNEDQQN